MAKNSFEWDYQAAGDLLLRSQEIAEFCEKEAERLTRATGMKYQSDVRVRGDRVAARGYDYTKNDDGQYKNRGNGKVVYTQRRIRRNND